MVVPWAEVLVTQTYPNQRLLAARAVPACLPLCLPMAGPYPLCIFILTTSDGALRLNCENRNTVEKAQVGGLLHVADLLCNPLRLARDDQAQSWK